MTAPAPGASARASTASTARAKVTGAARYATSTPVEGVALRVPVQATIARGRDPRRRRTAALARARRARGAARTRTRPRLARPTTRELARAAVADGRLPRPDRRARWSPSTLEVAPRGRRRSSRSSTRPQAHDVELRAATRRSTRPSKVNPDYPTDTEQGDVDAASRRRRSTSTRRTRRRPSTTTRWSRTRRSRVWDGDGADPVRLDPGRAARRATWSRRCSASSRSRCG